ncbi:hypothetical protein C2S51_019029 [Perilla frutescens var. frutescens]|nr:hypothetical protein C2S51_019029 [Perilla frutescens var. frutescens]
MISNSSNVGAEVEALTMCSGAEPESILPSTCFKWPVNFTEVLLHMKYCICIGCWWLLPFFLANLEFHSNQQHFPEFVSLDIEQQRLFYVHQNFIRCKSLVIPKFAKKPVIKKLRNLCWEARVVCEIAH